MKLTRISKIIFILFLLALAIFFLLNLHQALLRKTLELTINQTVGDLFKESVRLEKALIDFGLRLRIENVTLSLQSESGPVPIKIREITSKNSLFSILKPDGLTFSFRGANFQSSKRDGISGNLTIRGIRKWKIHLETDALDIDLDDLIWLNPENLKGSTGLVEGNLAFDANASDKADLTANFEIKAPGGNLQGKFFGLITPYLPPQTASNVTGQLATSGGLVRYQTAGLNLNLIRSNQLKVVLKILIPDYNLDLNLNLVIRLEDQNSITDLAQLMGIIKAKY